MTLLRCKADFDLVMWIHSDNWEFYKDLNSESQWKTWKTTNMASDG